MMSAASSRPAATPGLKFPRACRLRRPAQFKHVYAAGCRLGNEFFTASSQANQAGVARLGMSIAARALRRAVDRNRMRRLIRESFRAHRFGLPALDLVIGVRSGAQSADNARLRAALEQLWRKLSSTCT